MHTPRGILEFKYFFSSHVGTADGGECSATAIRAIIKKFVAAEKPEKPLSDNKIATLLEQQGINVARIPERVSLCSSTTHTLSFMASMAEKSIELITIRS